MQLYGLIDKNTKNMVRVKQIKDGFSLCFLDDNLPILMRTSPSGLWRVYKEAIQAPKKVSLKLCKIQILLEEVDDEDKSKNKRRDGTRFW